MAETFFVWLSMLLTICLVMLIIVTILMVTALPKNPDDMILTISGIIITILTAAFLPIMWTTVMGFNLESTCLSVMAGMNEICLE